MIRFFLTFMLILLVLFGLELLEPVQKTVVLPWTSLIAQLSAWLLQLFDSSVLANGIILRSRDNGVAVSIQAGCNGVEATIVLIAAILAFPAPWRSRVIGFGAGFLAIQALNLVRIISLFYLLQWNRTAFEWAHLYLWQGLIMLDALLVFLVWLRLLPEQKPQLAANG